MTRRRQLPRWTSVLFPLVVVAGGCSGPILRPQSPESLLEDPQTPTVKLVSEYTHPFGLNYAQVEAVSLVSGLPGTGGDPPPSSLRATLLAEMKRRQVEDANQILASPTTALVLVRGILRPGIRKGDRFDVEVRVPRESEATSLRGGWLLPTRLSEVAIMDQQLHKGHDFAVSEGPVLVDPSADEKEDPALSTKGRILGGGVALKGRPLGLIIRNPHQSARMSREIAASINKRFHAYVAGRSQGVATPKTEEFIELEVHPRYKDNITRYVRVVRSVGVGETAGQLQSRLLSLERQLMDPLTAATAALRLEAIGGDQVIEMLREASKDDNPEVRFYAAEALAYLDDTSAAEPLADAARNEPAFRVNAFAALSAMDDVIAHEALRELLSVKSAETRYGAFRALWAMDANSSLVRGEQMGDQFSLHVLDVGGPVMVHVTRSYRPEVVLFGADQKFELPLLLDAGKNILVNGMSGSQITVSRFRVGQEPEQRVTTSSVEDVIRTIVDLGGTYPDVVQALQQAKANGALASRFRVDALPEPGRSYDRPDGKLASESTTPEVATPLPDLFSRRR